MFRMNGRTHLLFIALTFSKLFAQTPEAASQEIEVCLSVVNALGVSIAFEVREFRNWDGDFASRFKNGCGNTSKGAFSYRVQTSGFQGDAGLIRGEAVLFSKRAKLTLFDRGDLGELDGKPVSMPVGTLELSGRLKGPGAPLVTSISLIPLFRHQRPPIEVRPDSDGTFVINNVHPGSYVLVAFRASTPLTTQSILVKSASGSRIERDLQVPAPVNRE